MKNENVSEFLEMNGPEQRNSPEGDKSVPYNEVFIKQEIASENFEIEDERNCNQQLEQDCIKDEIKIEYLGLENTIHQELLNSPNVGLANSDSNQPKIYDNILIIKGPNDEKRYGCKKCEFNTKHKVSLNRHIKLHNPDEMQSYKCTFCGFETLYRRHLDVHVKVLHEKEPKTKLYKCDQCSYACDYRENLTRHKKIHLAPEERNSFVCNLCGFETFYRKSYRVHMEMIHQVDANKEEVEFRCYHCPFVTRYRVNIVRHLKTHMKGNTKIYKCSDCDFQTIHKTNFNTHVLRHKDPSKIKIFQCQHCSHKTFYKASLRNHIKLHMKKEEVETYKCDFCDFATIYERSLKLHVLYMHNGNHKAIEYFKCTFCDFETRYRENWRRHEKGHLKPGKQDTYNCTECSFSTIQQGRYEKHILVHASPEQLATLNKKTKISKRNKRFRPVIDAPSTNISTTTMLASGNIGDIDENQTSSFTAKRFNDGQELTMFQCCHCSYKTLSEKMLNEHLNSHQRKTYYESEPSRKPCDEMNVKGAQLTNSKEQKSFSCNQCSFTTIHGSSMRRHRETHLRVSERIEYKCPTCVFRSFTRATVNSHKCPNRSRYPSEVM